MLLGSYVPPIVVGAWGLWCTWVAFTGGVMPVPFVKWNVEGGIGQGLLFLFVITPVLTGIATQLLIWITILCTVVVVAVRGIRANAGISRMTPETSARLVRADEMESNAIFLAPREPENPFPIQRAPITVLEVDTVPVVDPELIHIQREVVPLDKTV